MYFKIFYLQKDDVIDLPRALDVEGGPGSLGDARRRVDDQAVGAGSPTEGRSNLGSRLGWLLLLLLQLLLLELASLVVVAILVDGQRTHARGGTGGRTHLGNQC